jgi:TPR repeat protein
MPREDDRLKHALIRLTVRERSGLVANAAFAWPELRLLRPKSYRSSTFQRVNLAAESDDDARVELAVRLLLGRNCARDADRAIRLLEQAASHDNWRGMHNLVLCLCLNWGDSWSPRKCNLWLSRLEARVRSDVTSDRLRSTAPNGARRAARGLLRASK